MTQMLGYLRFMVILGALTLAGCAQDSSLPAGSPVQPIAERMLTPPASVRVINRNQRISALPEFTWTVTSLSPQIITVLHQNGTAHTYPGVASQSCSPSRTERSIGRGELPIVIRRDCRMSWNSTTPEETFTTVFRKTDGMMLARYLSADASRFQVLLLDPSFGVQEATELGRQLN
jgi:hypothetical protein